MRGLTVALLCGLGTFACGDDDGGVDAGTDSGSDASADVGVDATFDGGADAAMGSDSLQVVVGVDGVYEGATVVLRRPDGVELMAQTDAEGQVLFEGLDLAQTHMLSAWDEDLGALTISGLTRDALAEYERRGWPADAAAGVLELSLQRTSSFVTLGGMVTNKEQDTRPMIVSPRGVPGSFFNAPGAAFELSLTQPANPVELQVVEWGFSRSLRDVDWTIYRWATTEVDASTSQDDLVIDLAAATEVAPTTMGGAFRIPVERGSFFTGSFIVVDQVEAHGTETGGLVGFTRSVRWSFEESVATWTLDHVPPPEGIDYVTRYALQAGERLSFVEVDTIPVDVDTPFFPPPLELNAMSAVSPDGEVRWVGDDEPIGNAIDNLVFIVDDEVTWQISVLDGSESVNLSEAPAALRTGRTTGETVNARLQRCPDGSNGRLCTSYSVGRVLNVIQPAM